MFVRALQFEPFELSEPFDLFIDHEAGEIICFRPSVRTGAEWSILVLGFAKYSKGPVKHKSATLLKNIVECASQGAFKIVGRSKVSTGCAAMVGWWVDRNFTGVTFCRRSKLCRDRSAVGVQDLWNGRSRF